jgi:hypothetical protein
MNPPHAPAMTPMIDTDNAREGKGKREKGKEKRDKDWGKEKKGEKKRK